MSGLRAARKILRSDCRQVAYLGWSGEGNLGDDLILEAHVASLPRTDFIMVPRLNLPGTLRVAKLGLSRQPRCVLLGGGTLVGRTECYVPLKAMMDAWDETTFLMLGIGVEDPEFRGSVNYTTAEELRRWKPLLRRFHRVTVRGPRSQELLADIDVPARVVGDPALLLATAEIAPRRPNLIGVNVSDPEDSWGGGLRHAHLSVASALRALARDGFMFRFVACHERDLAPIHQVCEQLPNSEVVIPTSAADMIRAINDCSVFLGERLHSVIMAAAAYVPPVAIEYRPKCRDFQRSIGMEAFSLRSDRAGAGQVEATVRQLLDKRAHYERHIFQAVNGLRRNLEAAEGENREIVEAACQCHKTSDRPHDPPGLH